MKPPALALGAVGLDAERVDDEDEGAVALVEGVEVELDVVVAADAVAVGERRGHRARLGEGADAEVDGVGGVPDAHLGGVGRGPAVDRLVEREAVEDGGAGPGGFVEAAVDDDGRLDLREGDGRLVQAAVVDGRLGGRGELEGGDEMEDHAGKASRGATAMPAV